MTRTLPGKSVHQEVEHDKEAVAMNAIIATIGWLRMKGHEALAAEYQAEMITEEAE